MNRATVPPGWSIQPLGTLCGKPQYGLTDTASREPVGPRFLRITDIQDGEVLWDKVPFCRCSPTDLDRHRVASGDLLVARIGATTGKTFFVRDCPEETVFASYLIRLRPRDVHDRYLYYFCQSEMYWDHINAGKDERLKGGVNTQSLSEVPVMLPPPDEQIVIADVIESIEKAARVQSRIATNISALRSAMMTKLFRDGLRGETLRDSDIGPIPESWDVSTVGAVTDPVSGGTPSKQRPEWWRGTVPWASPKDMKKLRLRDTEDHITEEAVEEGSRLVPANTIFIVLRGMILAKDVPVAIADVPMAFNQDMRALMPKGAIDPDFLLYALRARKSALVQEIGTSAHGTRRMGSASIENLRVPVPRDESEQREIATVLNDLDKMEEVATAKCSSLKLLFSSMVNQLVTGAISVKGLDLTEASHA